MLILAVGAEYNVFILLMDFSVNPNRSKTKNKYSQLTRSKAFSASTPAKTAVVLDFFSVVYYVKGASNIILCLVSLDKTTLVSID